MPQLSLHTPVGALTVTAENDAIVAVDWGWGRDQEDSRLLRAARDQLQAYFDGALQIFDLPLRPDGTEHQRAVYRAMLQIPYGRTQTYGELARQIGSVARAVGGPGGDLLDQLRGSNPIPVIIPCHRVLAAASLGGYSGDGGLRTKQALLRLEGALEPTLL